MKVLIVGLGSIAQKHIKALREIVPLVEVYAWRSSAEASPVSGITNLYQLSDVAELAIDFAIICNPTSLHQQTIEALTPYQIPLFIEKPVFDHLNAETTIKAIQDNHIATYVACNLRFLGCIRFVKEYIQGKRVNEVNSYCGSYLPDWRPGQDFRKVYSANKEMGGGVHIDLIHEIDYLYWLFNAPDQVVVTKTSRSSLGISAIDYANYVMQYPDFSANVVLNYYRRDAKRTLEILLADGTLGVDLLKNKVFFNGEVIYSSSNTIAETYKDQMSFFIDHILKNKETFNPIEEAFEILTLCIAND
jgi:predicted dehydrogenase